VLSDVSKVEEKRRKVDWTAVVMTKLHFTYWPASSIQRMITQNNDVTHQLSYNQLIVQSNSTFFLQELKANLRLLIHNLSIHRFRKVICSATSRKNLI